MVSISDLQSTLAANLTIQNEQISQLVWDSSQTEEDVSKGNKELKKATQRRSEAQMVFWATIVFCGLVVGYDLVAFPVDNGEIMLILLGGSTSWVWLNGGFGRVRR